MSGSERRIRDPVAHQDSLSVLSKIIDNSIDLSALEIAELMKLEGLLETLEGQNIDVEEQIEQAKEMVKEQLKKIKKNATKKPAQKLQEEHQINPPVAHLLPDERQPQQEDPQQVPDNAIPAAQPPLNQQVGGDLQVLQEIQEVQEPAVGFFRALVGQIPPVQTLASSVVGGLVSCLTQGLSYPAKVGVFILVAVVCLILILLARWSIRWCIRRCM